ncbi:hypothetical protein KRR40_19320 [Niabella defluvii]|nr:hypothetical protein KRR40_19320 [Niabella sp. I65]
MSHQSSVNSPLSTVNYPLSSLMNNLTWHLFALHLNEISFNHENLAEIKVAGKKSALPGWTIKRLPVPLNAPMPQYL